MNITRRLAGVIIAGIILAWGRGGVFAEEITPADYTVITPEGLNITQQGWNQSTGITASSDKWIKLTVTASTDSKLTSDRGHIIPYVLTSRDGGSAMRVWEFSPLELHVPGGTTKHVGAMIDLTNGRPGTYTTNLTYIVSADIAPGNIVDLSQLTEAYTAQDGDVLTGTAGADAHITVAAGAMIILWNADITSISPSHKWAGITCEGDATLILDGTNKVKGGNSNYPGIHIVSDDTHPNSTLTIKGSGKLEASSNGYGAGIGGGYNISCGNIVIEGGTITATGGNQAASIGSGYGASCGTITITGGTVNATGGTRAAGIGSGQNASCGTITITSGVTQVTATKGTNAPNSIGAGDSSSCGTVSIEDESKVIQN